MLVADLGPTPSTACVDSLDNGETKVPDYQYVGWFREHTAQPDDQDYEWPACFVVEGTDAHTAQEWGDWLAASYSRRHKGCEFLRSYLDANPWANGQGPRVAVGEDAPDDVIGW